ncbi:MAG: toxin glutamine deamidase domain-containing protein [Thermomicrobiales bacterium]
MSALEDLCRTLEAVNRDAETLAAELTQRARTLAQSASVTATLGAGSNRPETAHTAQALQSASQAVQQAALLLHQVSVEGRGFVSRHAGANTSQSNGNATVVMDMERFKIADALHGAEDPRAFRLKHPKDYIEPMSRAHSVEPFRDPHKFVDRINPDFETAESYEVNCADCARCCEATWRGHEQQAAGRAYQISRSGGLEAHGESSETTEDWAHEMFMPIDATSLRSALEQYGHGSSALVHSSWEGYDPQGHAYNVVNFNNEILTIDSQRSEVHKYAENIYPGMERLPGVDHRAMVWDAKGRRVL